MTAREFLGDGSGFYPGQNHPAAKQTKLCANGHDFTGSGQSQ
jgi:hypothetical protein